MRHVFRTRFAIHICQVSMPNRVWLVRGNHEDRTMNEQLGVEVPGPQWVLLFHL